ncbi:hypothetical protein P7C73_g589, partial [Tremellales sp. Uapishka_1]
MSPPPLPPPSYALSSLDRSPSLSATVLPLAVPPPIYLRQTSPFASTSHAKGNLKIHIPAWGVVLVRPPRVYELQAHEPPCEDYVLSGALEVVMKERRKCLGISVGVQSVCKLNMGKKRGWEEDGIFERGVEVVSDPEEGIWLEKGSQSFSFVIHLPATLAAHDAHTHGRISYILTARVEGLPTSSRSFSLFRSSSANHPPPRVSANPEIPYQMDFETVLARTPELSLNLARSRSKDSAVFDDNASAISIEGNDSPTPGGLFHRRLSSDVEGTPPRFGSRRASSVTDKGKGKEEDVWLKGDITSSRSLLVHANPSLSGSVTPLDINKSGFVDGLGIWTFVASADVFSIASIFMLSFSTQPSPKTAIYFFRLLLSQSYAITSPRTPNEPPLVPESPRTHVLYHVGRPHRQGERVLGPEVPTLWRGGKDDQEDGFRSKAVIRMPPHEKIRPTTHEGSITPLRVSHEMIVQMFYAIDGMNVKNEPVEGPGELRMMQIKIPILVPSVSAPSRTGQSRGLIVRIRSAAVRWTPSTSPPVGLGPAWAKRIEEADSFSSLDQNTDRTPQMNIDQILSCRSDKLICACGATFAEAGEAHMRRVALAEEEERRGRAEEGGPKAREASQSGRRDSNAQ